MNEEEIAVNPCNYGEYATEGLVHFRCKGAFAVDGITYNRFESDGVSRNIFDFLPDDESHDQGDLYGETL